MTSLRVFHVSGDPPLNWLDGLVYGSAGICQSLLWASVNAKLDGAVPHFLEVYANDGRKCLSLLLLERPETSQGALKFFSSLAGLRRGASLHWQDGPGIHVEDPIQLGEAFKSALQWVDAYALQNRISNVRGIPAHGYRPEWLELLSKATTTFNYRSKNWATYIVDLKLTEEQIWMNLKSAGRKSVRKARNLGLATERLEGKKGVDLFLQKYHEFEHAAGRSPRSPARTKTLSLLDRDQHYHFYVARDKDGVVLATLGMHMFAGGATEIASSLSPTAYEAKLPAQDLLHWDMMMAAKAQGCHTFDLAGVDPKPKDAKSGNIARFKGKWGGKYAEYPIYVKRFQGRLFQRIFRGAGILT